MSFFKKLLGIAPTPTGDGAYSPSRLALKLATSTTTDYDGGVYNEPYTGGKLRVLMVCTEERNMVMANGEKLTEVGLTIINKKADSSCHVDPKLITGASPKAANGFGRLAAENLLTAVSTS